MKLDASVFRYLDKDAFRVLTAVEMGMKNHQWVSAQLIESIAHLRRGNCFKVLSLLMKHKLIVHQKTPGYDGYKLTYNGFDFLALRALVGKGFIRGVGTRIGVGKESDIHVCEGAEGEKYALKLHRLGRVSFKTIKTNRDYLQHRQSASWMYMARLAATKEFAYMKALKEGGFRVPEPIEQNRHAVLMRFIEAKPLYQIRELKHSDEVLEKIMRLLVRLARAGLIHGDFNEFNLMIDSKEQVTLIDFPQVVSTTHRNAKMYFERDVECIKVFFARRFGIHVEVWPEFEQAIAPKKPEEVAEEGKNEEERQATQALQAVTATLGDEDDALLTACLEENRQTRRDPQMGSGSACGSASSVGDAEEYDEDINEERELGKKCCAHDDEAESEEEEEEEEEEQQQEQEEEAEEEMKTILLLQQEKSRKKEDAAGHNDESFEDEEEDDVSEYDEENQPEVKDQIGVLKRKKVVRKVMTAEDVKKNLQKKHSSQTAKHNKNKNAFKQKARQEAREIVREVF